MPFMEEDADREVYGPCQRAFLQSLLSRQSITYEEAKSIIAAIQTAATPERETLENDVTQEDFETYIQAVGDAISPFDFEIRSSIHQKTRERTYALVNTTSDALTQIATTHTPDEIAFVKRVLDVMFDENNTPRAEIMAVKSNRALKCHKPPRESTSNSQQPQSANSGLTMTQAERLLQSLVAEGWFEFNDETSYYSLSQRALMELRTWLVDAYNEPEEDENEDDEPAHQKIKFCAACKDIVTVGQRCPNLGCNARLHDHCMRNYFRAQNNREQCAVCQTAWVDAPYVGEKAAAARDGGGGRRGGNAGRTSAGASRRSESAAPVVNGHEVESEEGDDGEEMYE